MDSVSNQIDSFLKFLRNCQEANRIAAIQEIDMDNATQDILHNIELSENYPDDYILQGITLANIRKKRREAKNTQRVTFPVTQWSKDNQKVINDLEKLLGSVRKAEKATRNRTYTNRTDILDGILEKEK